MTIEQKAIAYDKAFKWIRSLYPTMTRIDKEDAEHFFPELKESEDEKIKKAVHIYLDWLDGRKEIAPRGEYSIRDMISWLEKQKVLSAEEELQGKKDVLWCIKQASKYAKDENEMGTCWFAEKWLEKQSEQKLANKIEPKFKVGDWVVFNNNHNSVYQIEKIDDYEYTLRHFLGGSMPLSFSHEDMIRPWTIEDAKNGDVLSWDGSKCVALFKNIYDKESFNSHGFVGHCTGTFEARLSYHDIEGAHPATKEQHDTLMKAMADEGYIFDFEKKELKKIEDEIEIPFGTKDNELQEATYYIPKGFHAEIDDDKVVIKKGEKNPTDEEMKELLRTEYEKGRADAIAETQVAWSEEDEKMLNLIIDIFEVNHPNGYFKANELGDPNMKAVYTEEIVAWLKDLKQRITNKQ